MISFDNHFNLPSAALNLEKPAEGEVTLISHAHTDHLPTRYSDNHLYCSPITRKIIAFRKQLASTKTYDSDAIKQLNAGHILGSNMFLINDELLYTGDFNTKGIYCGTAKPQKCKTLIMECTYGSPEYIFPPKQAILKELRDYIQEHGKVLITTLDSGFGKPQEVCHALDDYNIPFALHERIVSVNEHLGLQFKNYDPESSVVITDKSTAETYPSTYKRVSLTGWFAASSWKHGQRADKGFTFSNHCDYPALIDFVEKCDPEKVYTHHGPSAEFAKDLRKLGFNASPLSDVTSKPKKGILQQTLTPFSI